MFKQINIRDIKESPVKLLADDWALVSAGDKNGYNTMTVSWGGIGELWGRDMVTIYIRPQRYTHEFIEKSDYFSLAFFDDDKKDVVKLCGSVSGRDVNKAEKAGITPLFDENAPYFKEAKLVIICKKAAKGYFDPNEFIDSMIMNSYADNDYHQIYYGAIEKVLINE